MTRQQQGIKGRLNELRRLASSDDWSTRESGGFGLRDLIETDFDEAMSLTTAWPTDPSAFVRRAACLGCMQRKAVTDDRRVRLVLKRLETTMHDDDAYVRKCCGPFVVGYLGYTYPHLTLPWLRKMATSRDLNVRANVAKAFSQALGRRYPDDAMNILNVLADDDRHRVAAAVGASVRNIARHFGPAWPTAAEAWNLAARHAATTRKTTTGEHA